VHRKLLLFAAVCLIAVATQAQGPGPVIWTSNGAPTTAAITGGPNNPIISTAPLMLNVNAQGVPANPGNPVTIPANTPVVGNAQGFFAGRVRTQRGLVRRTRHYSSLRGLSYAEA